MSIWGLVPYSLLSKKDGKRQLIACFIMELVRELEMQAVDIAVPLFLLAKSMVEQR